MIKNRFTTAGVAAALVLLAGCTGAGSLSGTTWKGGNLMDSNVSLAFTSASDCRLDTSFMGSGPCTYQAGGDQVAVTFDDQTYVFAIDQGTMTGLLFGAVVQLAKQ